MKIEFDELTTQFSSSFLSFTTLNRKLEAMSRGCAIFLDDPDSTYFPGDVIRGVLQIGNVIPGDVRDIYVICVGHSLVDLPGFSSKFVCRLRSIFEDRPYNPRLRKTYLEERIILKHENNPNLRRRYPFSFVLPNDIPPSFRAEHGTFRYAILGFVHLRRRINRYARPIRIIHPFDVRIIVDLNRIPRSMISVPRTAEKTSGFWCFKSTSIIAQIWLNRTGFVTGEMIYFSAYIDNRSGRKIKGSKVQLVKRIHYHARGSKMSQTVVIYEEKFGIRGRIDSFPIKAPLRASPIIRHPYRNTINAYFEIRFIVDLGPWSSNLVVAHEIIVGDIPFQRNY